VPGPIRASTGAGKQGKCSESCFLVFLQEQEHGKQGPKGRENEEKRNSLKENATKLPTEFPKQWLHMLSVCSQACAWRTFTKVTKLGFSHVSGGELVCRLKTWKQATLSHEKNSSV